MARQRNSRREVKRGRTLSVIIVAITRFSAFTIHEIFKQRGVIAGAVNVSAINFTAARVWSGEAGSLALFSAPSSQNAVFLIDVRNTYGAGWERSLHFKPPGDILSAYELRCQSDTGSDQCAKLHGGLDSDLKIPNKVVKMNVKGNFLKSWAAGEHLFI